MSPLRRPVVSYAEVGDGITLAYEEFGDRSASPLLLIAGLGTQMLGWRDDFCRALADEGLRVIRFDNRDAGESTYLDGHHPDLRAVMAGDTSSAAYGLDDMARDVAGLLDHLELDAAHVVGASMGGMIAQALAASHPERVISLTSIMSTTGERAASQPTEEATRALMQPVARSADEAAEHAVAAARVIGSPGYPTDPDEIRDRARLAFERGYNPLGFVRQLAAIYKSGDRTETVRGIRVPTLVIHGEDDPLIPLAGGRATAAAVEGAELVVFPGMAHDVPRELWPQLIDAIVRHARSAEAARVSR